MSKSEQPVSSNVVYQLINNGVVVAVVVVVVVVVVVFSFRLYR